jgi:hypothetical protein
MSVSKIKFSCFKFPFTVKKTAIQFIFILLKTLLLTVILPFHIFQKYKKNGICKIQAKNLKKNQTGLIYL